MKYNVDKKKFAKLLINRPTVIKKVSSLDEDMAAYLIEASPTCYQHLGSAVLRASIKVVRAYIKRLWQEADPYNSSLHHHIDIRLIPRDTLRRLEMKERKMLLKRKTHAMVDIMRSYLTYDEWLYAVENGQTIRDVPEEYWKRTTLWRAYAKQIKGADSGKKHVLLPDVYWEKDSQKASESLVDMVRDCPFFVTVIPPKRVTKEHLMATFQSGKEIHLGEDYRDIPTSSWDRGVAVLAINSDRRNIDIIPTNLLTEDDALRTAQESLCGFIPEKLLTRKVKISIAAHKHMEYSSGKDSDYRRSDAEHFPELNDVSFQLAVVSLENKHGPQRGVRNIQEFVTPANRTLILEANPYFMQFIPKLEQTDEIINIFLSKATPKVLDDMAEYINMGKIKKSHAPLLIGCTNNLILSTAEKKLKRTRRTKNATEHIETKKNTNTVEITVAPVEFAKIRTQLDRYKD